MSTVSGLKAAFGGAVAAFVIAAWPGATLAGSIPTGKPEDVGMSSERLARIGPAMQKHIDAGEIAGVVTLVARRGRIVHFEAHGYSDIAKRTPMRTDAIRLGVLEMITAVAILMLVERRQFRCRTRLEIHSGVRRAGQAVARPGGPITRS
jgi:CubicO group peptidase (beta-lactamase class C family)